MATNVLDTGPWGIDNPRWKGRWAIHTPKGRKFLVFTENQYIDQGTIWEIEVSLDEAYNRRDVRNKRVDKSLEQITLPEEYLPPEIVGNTEDEYGNSVEHYKERFQTLSEDYTRMENVLTKIRNKFFAYANHIHGNEHGSATFPDCKERTCVSARETMRLVAELEI